MDRSARWSRTAGALAVLGIIASACAAQSGGGGTPLATGAEGGPSVQVAHDAKLGDLLTGEGGKTLYLFTKDTAGSSACVDACAATWPPFTLQAGEAVVAGTGVTGTFAARKRADGSSQVTYNDRPLYYFAADGAAGDTKGQGVNDVWFVVTPAGQPGGPGGSPAPSDEGYNY